MRRAWVVLLTGCGFQSSPAGPGDNMTVDAATVVDAPPSSIETCWRIAATNPVFNVSACVAQLAAALDVQADTAINTTAGTSVPVGLACAKLTVGSAPVCALAASSIRIRAGVTLSAHGDLPLALLAHTIQIEGVVDVASHSTGPLQAKGPGADRTGCRAAADAADNGGGAGGTLDGGMDSSGAYREGGDGGTSVSSGPGRSGSSIAIGAVLGGCEGSPSSKGPGLGGHGGGAVWIAADTGTLVIASGAIINASGAGGKGGAAVVLNRGGYGGGSGGLIVLQSPAISRGDGAKIFANGGGGGAGATLSAPGAPGQDPTDPAIEAPGGASATANGDHSGAGGRGYSKAGAAANGGDGDDLQVGGGGGGGGAGAIRVASPTDVSGPGVSPDPVPLE